MSGVSGSRAARIAEDACAALVADGRADDAYLVMRLCLGHDSAIVRETAALTIAETFGGHADAADTLARVLRDDPSRSVREACRDGLFVMESA